MIQKVSVFLSTYNIVIGLVITLLALSGLEFVRSLTNDIVIPLFKEDIETYTYQVYNKKLRVGLFIATLSRLAMAIFFILIIISLYPDANKES